MMRVTETVKHLIIINVIFFAATFLPSLHDVLYNNLSLYYIENPNFKLWQLVSHMFMHGNFWHIFFNMFVLALFGSALEMLWGRNRFLVFYFITGIGAGLVYTAVNYFQFHQIFDALVHNGISKEYLFQALNTNNDPQLLLQSVPENDLAGLFNVYLSTAVGASGALYGVLAAFAFKFPNTELYLMFIPIPIKAKYLIPALVGLDLFSGLTGQSIFGGFGGGGIAHFAHVGGALVGYLLMLYFNRKQFKRWD